MPNCFDRNIRIAHAASLPYVIRMATNAILSETAMTKSNPIDARRWQAVTARDSALDGAFVFAVSSTGIFCRPSCPSKRPRRENVSFFERAREAEQAGYRACLRCRPKAVDGNPQAALVRSVCRYIEQNIEDRLTLGRLASEFRRSPFHLQRIPRGETRSYSSVAKKIGMPKATRAVARACATNPVAVAIPCHRVVREDGELGGYRWGIERKEQLLAMEKHAGA